MANPLVVIDKALDGGELDVFERVKQTRRTVKIAIADLQRTAHDTHSVALRNALKAADNIFRALDAVEDSASRVISVFYETLDEE